MHFLPPRHTQLLTKPEKTDVISRRHHQFPLQLTSKNRSQKFHTDDTSLPKRGNASDWLRQISHAARPIRNTSQISKVARDRLRSLLRRRFAEKPVVASRNVGCFLRLPLSERFETSKLFFLRCSNTKRHPTELICYQRPSSRTFLSVTVVSSMKF